MVSAVFHWYPLNDLASVVQKVDNTIPGLKIHSGLLLVMSTVGRNFRTVTSLYWLVKILKIIWQYLEPSRQTSKNTILKKRCLSSSNIIVWKCFFFLVSYLCVESKWLANWKFVKTNGYLGQTMCIILSPSIHWVNLYPLISLLLFRWIVIYLVHGAIQHWATVIGWREKTGRQGLKSES